MKRCLQCDTEFDGACWRCPACGYEPETVSGMSVFAPELAYQNDTYDARSFARLAEIESGHFWFEARNRLLLWLVQKYFPNPETLFEVGCGTGFVLQHLSEHLPHTMFYGSDLLLEGLRFAAYRVPDATLFQMDARQIPYRNAFDMLGAFDVIEHIDEDEAVLDQMFQAIKPGGGIIISVPQHQFLWSIVDDMSYHKRRYSKDELTGKIERAGFQVLMTTSFVSLLLPFMVLSRRRKTASVKTGFDRRMEFKLGPLLNTSLSRVMDFERLLIRSGVSFRAGGSRLIVARRPVQTS